MKPDMHGWTCLVGHAGGNGGDGGDGGVDSAGGEEGGCEGATSTKGIDGQTAFFCSCVHRELWSFDSVHLL